MNYIKKNKKYEKKYFHSYHFIEKAKLLKSYVQNEHESEEIIMAFSDIKEMTNKLEFKSDVDKYMQSFSSIDDNEINNEISTNINSTEMDEKNNSVDSSDLDSNN